MSEEHKALGYRPPPGSLVAKVHAAAQHPEKSAGQDTAALIKAVEDVRAIKWVILLSVSPAESMMSPNVHGVVAGRP